MIRATALLALAALTGCMTEDKYYASGAKLSCKKAEECNDDFGDAYDDVDDCITETEKNTDDAKKFFADQECEFNAGNAAKCLKEAKKGDCDSDAPKVCEDVYENCETGDE